MNPGWPISALGVVGRPSSIYAQRRPLGLLALSRASPQPWALRDTYDTPGIGLAQGSAHTQQSLHLVRLLGVLRGWIRMEQGQGMAGKSFGKRDMGGQIKEGTEARLRSLGVTRRLWAQELIVLFLFFSF